MLSKTPWLQHKLCHPAHHPQILLMLSVCLERKVLMNLEKRKFQMFIKLSKYSWEIFHNLIKAYFLSKQIICQPEVWNLNRKELYASSGETKEKLSPSVTACFLTLSKNYKYLRRKLKQSVLKKIKAKWKSKHDIQHTDRFLVTSFFL